MRPLFCILAAILLAGCRTGPEVLPTRVAFAKAERERKAVTQDLFWTYYGPDVGFVASTPNQMEEKPATAKPAPKKKIVTYGDVENASKSFTLFIAEDAKRNYPIPGARLAIVKNNVACRAALNVLVTAQQDIFRCHGVAPGADGTYNATKETCKTFDKLKEELEAQSLKDSDIKWAQVKYADVKESNISTGILTAWMELGILVE